MTDVAILCPYRGGDAWRDSLWNWVRARWETCFPDYLVFVGDSEHETFSRANAINDAYLQTGGNFDVCIIIDSDTFFARPEQIETAVERAYRERHVIIPYDTYHKLDRTATKMQTRQVPEFFLEPQVPMIVETSHTTQSGIVVACREAFEAVGGFDNKFIGWAPEDQAFIMSIDVLWERAHQRLSHERVFHLWHPETQEHNDELIDWFWKDYGELYDLWVSGQKLQQYAKTQFRERLRPRVYP